MSIESTSILQYTQMMPYDKHGQKYVDTTTPPHSILMQCLWNGMFNKHSVRCPQTFGHRQYVDHTPYRYMQLVSELPTN